MNPRLLPPFGHVLTLTLLAFVQLAQAAPTAYVAARYAGQVAAIDTLSHQVVGTINVGDGPLAVSLSRDGQRAYVTLGPQDAVGVIETASRTLVGRIPVGDNPTGLSQSADGTRLYVVNTGSRSLSIIDAANGALVSEIALPNHPFGVALQPDGRTLYVAGDYPGAVCVIDLARAAISANIPIGDSLGGIAVHPDGQTFYVVDSGRNELAVVDVARRVVVQRIAVGQTPVAVTLSRNGATAYVSNLFGNDAVSVVDTARGLVTSKITLPGPALAQGAALTPDGATLYVALRGASGVLAVNTGNNAIIGIVPVGGEPTGFGDFIGTSAPNIALGAVGSSLAHSGLGPLAVTPPVPMPALVNIEVAREVTVALMPGATVHGDDDVIFANGECLFVLDFASGAKTPIIGTPNAADATLPVCNDPQLQPIRHAAVSRDRKRILFNVGEDFSGEIATRLYLIDLPSRRTYRLLPGFSRVGVGGVDFAPNGAMVSAAVPLGDVRDPRVAEQSEVFRISADLSTVEQVTNLPNRGIADVAVSPDGTKLAFNALVLSSNNLEVVESDLDGTHPRVIIQGGAIWLDSVHDPEHSPDHAKVVYSRMRIRMPDGSECGPNWSHGGPRCHDLYVQPVVGATPVRVSPIGGTSVVPDWKDDRIVYAFSIGSGTSPGSWIGSVVSDENGYTMVPFGTYNLFAKWID